MNKWLKPSRPENEPILCPVMDCAHGMGQAGNGRCPGDPSQPGRECPEFVTQEEFEALFKPLPVQNKRDDYKP